MNLSPQATVDRSLAESRDLMRLLHKVEVRVMVYLITILIPRLLHPPLSLMVLATMNEVN